MLFLPLWCRPVSIADPYSHFPSHLHHIQEKIVKPPGAVYLQELIFISHQHVSIRSQGESVEAAAPLLEAVHELQSVTSVLWSGGKGGPYKCKKNVWFASSVTVVSKKPHQSAREICITDFPACEVHCALLCKNGEYGTATCQQPATPCKSSCYSQYSSVKTSV